MLGNHNLSYLPADWQVDFMIGLSVANNNIWWMNYLNIKILLYWISQRISYLDWFWKYILIIENIKNYTQYTQINNKFIEISKKK